MSKDNPVYLDYNATTPVRSEAVDAISKALALQGNPSSSHAAGRAARAVMEHARDQVAAAVCASPADIIFTSGGTEANGATLKGTNAHYLVVSAVEHDSVITGAKAATLPVHIVPVDQQGVIDLTALEQVLAREGEGGLVSVMLANNETGVIQPIRAIVDIAATYSAKVHCDAVQALGKIEVNFPDLGVDYMSISAHKIGGPKGVGALIIKAGAEVAPLVSGGGQEKGRRSGTENLPGIAGFGAAAALVPESLVRMQELQGLRDHMESELKSCASDLIIFGEEVSRLPNTTNVSMPGVTNELQLMTFDLRGLYVSAGSACSSGKVSASHVLSAMGVTDAVAGNSIRISLGWGSKADDVDQFIDAWRDVHARQTVRTAH